MSTTNAMAVVHRPLYSRGLDPRSTTTLSVGWLLSIILGGTLVLFATLAFILIYIRKRKAASYSLPYTHHPVKGLTADIPRQPRKLTKQRCIYQHHRSPIRRVSLPHVLPPITSSRSSFNIFNAPEGRRSNSWVDEDAIHGPKMRKMREKKKKDPWPLRPPTLPKIRSPGKGQIYIHENGPFVGPRPMATPIQPQLWSPQTRAAYEIAQRMDCPVSLPQFLGPRPPPRARLRPSATDSELADILRSTAERLRDGSRSPRRSRMSTPTRTPLSSPSKSVPESPLKTPTSLGSVGTSRSGRMLRTPSPIKCGAAPPPTPSSNRREGSRSSVASEPNSLLAEVFAQSGLATVVLNPRPSRTGHSPERTRSPSVRSRVSSSLSTLYSADEDEDRDGHGAGVKVEGNQRMEEKLGNDPFVSSASSRPQSWDVKCALSSSDRRSAIERASQRSSNRMQPLSQISGNAQDSPSSPTRSAGGRSGGNHNSGTDPMPFSIIRKAPPLLPPRDTQSTKTDFRTSLLHGASPGAGPTSKFPYPSPSIAYSADFDFDALDELADEEKVIPPHDLRPVSSSPTLGNTKRQSFRSRLDEDETDLIFPYSPNDEDPISSPPPHRPLPSPETRTSEIGSPSRLGSRAKTNPASPLRMVSNVSKSSSNYSEKDSESSAVGDIIRTSIAPFSRSFMQTPASPGESPSRDRPPSELESTVAKLRRMNSEVSTDSAASGDSSVTATVESPTLPDLRGGGFSPDRTNSRARKAGSRNYLTLGNGSPLSKGGAGRRRAGSVLKPGFDKQPGSGKENHDSNGFDLKMPMIDVEVREITGHADNSMRDDCSWGRATPNTKGVRFADLQSVVLISGRQGGERQSVESLGLYDEDGFLKSSPNRPPGSGRNGRGIR